MRGPTAPRSDTGAALNQGESLMRLTYSVVAVAALLLLAVSPSLAPAAGPGAQIVGTVVATSPNSVTVICQQTLWPPIGVLPATTVSLNGVRCYPTMLPIGSICTINVVRSGNV